MGGIPHPFAYRQRTLLCGADLDIWLFAFGVSWALTLLLLLPLPLFMEKGTDFYMTSLSAQALIDEWNNGMNLVDILEIMVPQV